MKIIRQGIDPKQRPIRATCRKCNTEIEFLASEARYVSDQRDGDAYAVKCPTCEDEIWAGVRSA